MTKKGLIKKEIAEVETVKPKHHEASRLNPRTWEVMRFEGKNAKEKIQYPTGKEEGGRKKKSPFPKTINQYNREKETIARSLVGRKNCAGGNPKEKRTWTQEHQELAERIKDDFHNARRRGFLKVMTKKRQRILVGSGTKKAL